MKKKIIIGLFAILLLATGCGKIPKLENGQEAIVAFDKEGKISVDDYISMKGIFINKEIEYERNI